MKWTQLFLSVSMAALNVYAGERTFVGTLWKITAGVSGTATGSISLAVGDTVEDIHFQKPYPGEIVNGCFLPGAIWRVHVQDKDMGQTTLLEGSCSGSTDQPIRRAAELTVRLLNLLAANDSEAAYHLMAADWRASHQLSDFEQLTSGLYIDKRDREGAPPYCVEVVGKTDALVRLKTGLDCTITRNAERAAIFVDIKATRTFKIVDVQCRTVKIRRKL